MRPLDDVATKDCGWKQRKGSGQTYEQSRCFPMRMCRHTSECIKEVIASSRMRISRDLCVGLPPVKPRTILSQKNISPEGETKIKPGSRDGP